MKAIVLVGGLGTRVAGLTRGVIPKPMLEVAGRPFLAHHLDWLVQQGIATIALATHHLAEVIAGHFGAAYRGVPLVYSYEQQPAGTGGAISRAAARLGEEPQIAVTNGDTFFPVDLEALRAFHVAKDAEFSLALARAPEAGRYGAVEIHPDGRVRRFVEKAGRGPALINGGVYILSPRALAGCPAEPWSFERDLLQPGIGCRAIYGLPSAAPFWDIGVPDDYQRFASEVST